MTASSTGRSGVPSSMANRGKRPWRFADHTSLGVGGPAGRVVHATGPADVASALRDVRDRGTDALLVFGGGTNVLVSDHGFDGTVMVMNGGSVEAATSRDANHVDFIVDAGMDWDRFVVDTISAGCGGLELTSGIPGTVGAAPMQNIAAYGQQVCDAITSVGVVERATLEGNEISAADCHFGYRTSRFKGEWRDRFVITHVRFRLPVADADTIQASTYGDIVKHFRDTGEDPADVSARRRAVLAVRAAKSMVLDPADPMARSAGSFFMNPEVSDALAQDLAGRFQAAGVGVQYLEGYAERRRDLSPGTVGDAEPHATGAAPGRRRIPAALLLRASGFHPGDRWNTVQLSDRHVLAVVSRPGASATDVWMVGHHVRHRVEEETGVSLYFEPVSIGAFPDFDPIEFERRYHYQAAPSDEPEWLTGSR